MTQPDPDPLTPPEPIESDWEHARRVPLRGCVRLAILAAIIVVWGLAVVGCMTVTGALVSTTAT